MTKRRGRGEGSIFQRSSGQWVGEYVVAKDLNGKGKKRTVYGKTKGEVQKKLQKLILSVGTGTLLDDENQNIATYIRSWLEGTARVKVKPHTYIGYECVLRLHIINKIGSVKLSKLSAVTAKLLFAELEHSGLSGRYRQMAYDLLRQSLKEAVGMRLINQNPLDFVARPRATSKKANAWDEGDIAKFLATVEKEEPRLYALYFMAVSLGLRQGELFALQWKNVDFKAASIAIEHTLTDSKGKLSLGDPKTSASRRSISLPDGILSALAKHKQLLANEGLSHSPWVFCDHQGGPLRRANLIRRSFNPLIVKAEVKQIRFHDLRHTAASQMLKMGIPSKVVQEILGHANIKITLDTYSHVLPGMHGEAAKQIDGFFKGLTA